MSICTTGRKSGLMVLCGLVFASAAFGVADAAPASRERGEIERDGASAWRGGERRGLEARVIVKFKERKGESVAERVARRDQQLLDHGLRLGIPRALERIRTLGTGADLVRVPADMEAAKVVAQLGDDPDVEYAEPDRIMKALATPDDSQYASQWHYFEATGGLNLPSAWDQSTGSGVRVAVLDTGYRPHADLAANIVGGYDFIGDTFVANDGNGRDSDARDPGDWTDAGECGGGQPTQDIGSSWHGTHVAGTIAAVTNNGVGVAGVAYGAKVVPMRVLGKCGGYTSDIADAIIWAAGGSVSGVPANANPAKVINMSLGGGGACDTTSQSAINTARSLGAVVIVAAGNEDQNASNSSPANCSGVVTVAAVNRSGGRAYYSNYGSVVDVAAPGGAQNFANDPNGILSTVNTGTTTPGTDGYEYFQGTSMATPHVAGVAALMLAKTPGLTPDQIETTLKNTARAFPATCSQCGTGIVDATAALGGGSPPPPPNTLTDGVAVTGLGVAAGGELRWTMSVPSGQSSLTFTTSGGTGDADLYVKFGSAPTTASYDCRPYKSGNAETCSFTSPAAGTWHVMLRAYTTFSGVSLLGDHAAAAPSSCPTGFTEYKGSLSSGGSAYVPNTTGYAVSVSGTHSGRLTGPTGTDFDLYLQKRSGTGSWSNVRSGTGSTSTENVDYSGTSGTYRWRVHAYSGSGGYTLCTKRP